jgi:hypothetical protein
VSRNIEITLHNYHALMAAELAPGCLGVARLITDPVFFMRETVRAASDSLLFRRLFIPIIPLSKLADRSNSSTKVLVSCGSHKYTTGLSKSFDEIYKLQCMYKSILVSCTDRFSFCYRINGNQSVSAKMCAILYCKLKMFLETLFLSN